jgi:hypothetical protein
MRVYIDGTQLANADNVEHAIDLARAHIQGQPRLIIDVLADGEPATQDHLENPGAVINELRFATTETSAFLTETASTAQDSIKLLKDDQSACADQLRKGELEHAMQSLGAIMDTWQGVRDIVDQVAQLADIEIATIEVEDQTGAAITKGLSESLSEVRESLQTQDWATLGDVVEYDLETHATRWSALLDSMIEQTQRA